MNSVHCKRAVLPKSEATFFIKNINILSRLYILWFDYVKLNTYLTAYKPVYSYFQNWLAVSSYQNN